MNNDSPSKPSFVFGYWRPWKEDSKFFDSYLNYIKDVSLTKYGSDTIGQYINQASVEQVRAINNLGDAIGRGFDKISDQLYDVNSELRFINKNLDLQIEQQRLSNLLLQNITELLRVPNSEKERQHSIELGIKFFVNAENDSDLFDDSLENLLKAESLMKQDYFVLHRIGCIYLYSEKHLNLEKAFDYFTRAGKYASVESDPKATRLVNALTQNYKTFNSGINTKNSIEKLTIGKQIRLEESNSIDTTEIKKLASESYEKAAFAAYIMANFDLAVQYQIKASNFFNTPQNQFLLAKYMVRNNEVESAIEFLKRSIIILPELYSACFFEIDLINEPKVTDLLEQLNQELNQQIGTLCSENKSTNSTLFITELMKLEEIKHNKYETKAKHYKYCIDLLNKTGKKIITLENSIDKLNDLINNSIFMTLSQLQVEKIKNDLLDLNISDKSYEQKQSIINELEILIDQDRVKIGCKYAGGIVFYIDDTGKHGLICSENDQWKEKWGIEGNFNTQKVIGTGTNNTKTIIENASFILESVFFWKSQSLIQTAARKCSQLTENGYSDWFLPSIDELILMNSLVKKNIGNIKSAQYWSSSEVEGDSITAYAYCFDKIRDWGPLKSMRTDNYLVRAVRKF